jgi:signal transduction histidine kinase
MVDDLLELGRTHALALHIQRRPVDVRALVAHAVATARARSGSTRVLLLAAAPMPAAVIDGQRLRQALDNLLENAVRHARREVRVEVTCGTGRELVVIVEDDGPGIERALLPRLFDPFAQGGERAGGAGMGLSTVRAIAEAHGGGIGVGIAAAGGARFTLRVPLVPVETVIP